MENPDQRSGKKRILIVEDDAHTRLLMQAILHRDGYETVLVANGREAESHIGSGDIDAVILDLMLPDTSGYDILAHIRDKKETKDLPVLVVSARSLEADIVEALSLGAGDYMRKPFNPRELVKRLEMLIQKAAERNP